MNAHVLAGAAITRWFVLQVERNRHESASDFARALEFEAYCPTYTKWFKRHGKLQELALPLFGVYMFVRFDPIQDPWGHLTHSKGKRCGIVKVLCSMSDPENPWPIPVSDRAIELVRQYKPVVRNPTEPYRFHAGEPCIVSVAGSRQTGIFEAYFGNRQFVKTWIFGSERRVEVAVAEIEPMNVETNGNLHPV